MAISISTLPSVDRSASQGRSSSVADSATQRAPERTENQSSSTTEITARTDVPEKVEGDVSKLNAIVSQSHRQLKFSLNDSTGEMIIQVLDATTDEVVRQIPSDEAVRLLEHLQSQGNSLLVDTKA